MLVDGLILVLLTFNFFSSCMEARVQRWRLASHASSFVGIPFS